MADRIELAELNISFVGGTDDLQKGVQQAKAVVTASFNKITESGDKVERSTENVDKSFKKLDTSAVNLAARINIMERAYDQFKNVAQQGMALAQLGAQSERVEFRFKKFAGTIGSSEELLVAFNKGSAGAVDQMTAMNSAALLVQQGLVTNNAEMEKTVEMATRLGDQTLGATHRLEFFSQLLKNQSIRLLDNFGISSGRVRTRIKELQEATAGLSREEAFRIATFEEGQKALDVLGEQVEDNALQFERATAKMQDMRVEMGQRLVPAGAKLMEVVSGLDNVTLMLITTLTGAVGIMAKFSGGMSGMLKNLKLTGKQFGVLALAIGTAVAAYEVYNDLMRLIKEGQEAAAEATATWADEVDAAVEDGASLSDQMGELADRVNVANDALHQDGNILMDLGAALVRTTSETKIMTDAADKARGVIIAQASGFEEANEMIKIYNERVENAKARLHEFTIVQFESEEAMDRWIKGVDRAGIAIDNVASISMEEWQRQQEETRLATEAVAEAEAERADMVGSLGRALDYAALRDKRMREQQQKTYETGQLLIEMENERMEKREKRAEAAAKIHEEALKQAEAEAEAILKVIELEEQALNTQLKRAEQLKDASAERVARVAISELEKAQKAGLISFDEYAQAVVEVQDRFGLADDASRALTLGLTTLVDGLITGSVAASEFDDILELMVKDAQDGVIAFTDLVTQVQNFEDAAGRFSRGVVDMAGGDGGGVAVATAQSTRTEYNPETGRYEPVGGGGGGGVTIYGDLNLEGVEDAEDFLRQLMSLME